MPTLAVCSAPPSSPFDAPPWRTLTAALRAASPDLILLNEMPFGAWIAAAPRPDERARTESRRLHDAGIASLDELGAPTVLGTRPALDEGRSVNEAFVWERGRGATAAHTKQFFPDEPGYYERRWFERGRTDFRVVDAGRVRVGFLICTEVMFNEWARYYGRAGAQLIAVPRATPLASTDRWRTALRMAAIVSGCYVASSNRGGADDRGQVFGGHGWIIDPLGEIIAETSDDQPVVWAELDFDLVRRAQREYPCYVEELPVDRYR